MTLQERITTEIVELTKDLVRIPSFLETEGRETRIQTFVYEWGKEHNLDVKKYALQEGVPLILLGIEGSSNRRCLLFNGHTDTVNISNMPDGLVPVIKEDWLYGRGAGDMKGGLAAMLAMISSLKQSNFGPEVGVYVAAVPGEERNGGQIGSRFIANNLNNEFNFCVIGEPTELIIGDSSRGTYVLKANFTIPLEKAPHPGLAVSSDNAMNAYHDFVSEVRRYITGYFEPDIVNVDTQEGKLLPFSVSSYYLRKTIPGESFDKDRALYEKVIGQLKKRYPKMNITFGLAFEEMQPMMRPHDNSICLAALSAYQEVIGKKASIEMLGMSNDGRILRPAGIDTILFGPIGEGYHSSDERVYIPSLFQTYEIYKKITETLCIKSEK